MQVWDPGVELCCPAAHSLQRDKPLTLANLPGSHRVQTLCPDEAWIQPFGQLLQLVEPGVVLYVPAVHSAQRDNPSSSANSPG